MLPLSDRAQALYDQLVAFMDAHVYPAEAVYAEQHSNSDDRWTPPPIIKELKKRPKPKGSGTCSCRKASTVPASTTTTTRTCAK